MSVGRIQAAGLVAAVMAVDHQGERPVPVPRHAPAPALSPRMVDEIAQKLLAQGFSPADIRKQLSARGVRWSYNFSASIEGRRHCHPGSAREKNRRLKQSGVHRTVYCPKHVKRPTSGSSGLCDECLSEKWAGGAF